MRIALVSDTHIPASLTRLPEELLSQIQGVDAILHAGDITSSHVLDTLAEIAPVTAVAGNMDPPELAAKLSDRKLLQMGGKTIGLKHGHQPHGVQAHYIGCSYNTPEMEVFFQLMSAQLPGADIIVFGHFHRPIVKKWKDVLFINPGAVAPAHGACSFALLELGETANVRIIPLASP
jgi:putative phosphoesterase